MPYSFTQIERKKSHTIRLVFIFLCLFYFVMALGVYIFLKWSVIFYNGYVAPLENSNIHQTAAPVISFPHFSLMEITSFGVLAILIAWWHWAYTSDHMFSRILTILKAQTLNKDDPYHAVFRNILDELSVATGGRDYQGYVLPTTAMNAFALEDFKGNAVIGLTEGLLSKLSRAQIESVSAHEAAHIMRGDSLETTMTISLYRLIQEILQGYANIINGILSPDDDHDFRVPTGKGGPGPAFLYFFFVSLAIMGLLHLTNFIGLLLNMFISRQREFRADAIAVRLSRDPQSLAEALYIISHRWRGAGLPGQNLDALFIMSPAYNTLEEGLGLVPELFSTHPPVEKRIGVLLDMVHADETVLEEALKRSPEAQLDTAFLSKNWVPSAVETSRDLPDAVSQWFVMQNEKWQGPFGLEQLMGLPWLCAESQIKKSGIGRVALAYEDLEVNQFLKLRKTSGEFQKKCPKCHVPLVSKEYEGTSVLECPGCSGVLAEEGDIQRILTRRVKNFDSRVKYLAELSKSQTKVMRKRTEDYLYAADGLVCPKCLHVKARMFRQFFNLLYKVEVDKCQFCGLVWFDKDELEILQCLYEELNADGRR